jgi:hypothetical protein
MSVSAARYIVAKYVPELLRNEPRNVGVIVWTPEKVDARFWGENGGGDVDGRKVPEWVQSQPTYKEWVHFWRNCIVHGAVQTKDKTIHADTVKFLDALKEQTGNANYILGDTGSVTDEIEPSDLPALTSYLFDILVDRETDEETAKNAYQLERACNKVIRKTRVFNDKRFIRDKGVFCKITEGVNELFQFDYYYGGNGDPTWLSKRVPLGTRQLNKHVDSTAWQFEKVIRSGVIPKERGAALIMPTEKQRSDEQVQRAINVLHTVTRVIDLNDQAERLEHELNELPGVSEAESNKPFTE